MPYNYNHPEIWVSHYWFVLHTIALNYPLNPNNVCKKKYYNFIQTIPLLIPNENISNLFIQILDKFPVTPYLDSRESFTKWTHFIHNHINVLNNKKELSYEQFINKYKNYYKPKKPINIYDIKLKKTIYFSLIIIFLILLIVFISKNNTI